MTKLFNNVIKLSEPFVKLAEKVTKVTSDLQRLTEALAIIANNQTVHHQMIVQMWNVHQAMVKHASDSASSLSMPDIDKPKSEKDTNGKPKPN